MLKMAKKYNTNLAAIHLSPALRVKLPTWYHPGGAPHPLMSVAAKCLLTCHSVKTIADLIKLACKIRSNNAAASHVPSQVCTCLDCVQDRLRGCKNPHACTT
ncbi:hypothetical protein EDB87DRAFT_1538618, partial [Lactarius vividus]